MKDELLSKVYKELNITSQVYGIREICMAIYSTAGKMALASLWDHTEGEKDVSVHHFKNRIEQILKAYLALYPEAKFCPDENQNGIIEDIYEIYRRNGFFYHSPYHLSPAAFSSGGTKGCVLYRGMPPEQESFMSGLGFYSLELNAEPGQSIVEMFGLQTKPFSDYLQEVLKSNEWTEIDWPEDTTFLRMKEPFSRGYWQNEPDKSNNISMARYGAPNKLYVFYRWQNDHFEQKPIPAWRVDDFRTIGQQGYWEYRRIASALLDAVGRLPPVNVSFRDNIVQIKLGYRLPPAEEDLFKLYSWPLNYCITSENTQVFQREMSGNVYPVFKQHLESIGYRFVEE